MTKFLLFKIHDRVKPINFYLDKIKAAFHSLGLTNKCLSCTSDGDVWVRVELALNFFDQVYKNDPDTPFRQGIENRFRLLLLHPLISMVSIQDDWPLAAVEGKNEDTI